MGTTADLGKHWQRDFVVDGVPASGINPPAKADGRATIVDADTRLTILEAVAIVVGSSTPVVAETTRAATAESTLTTNLAAEVTRATAAEALRAPLASPAFTGVPTAPTATAGTNTTQLATTAFATAATTTNATAITAETTRATAAEALKAPLASPALTGTPTAPTATAGTNTTQLATTAFATAATTINATAITAETTRATAAEALKAPLASPALTGVPTAPTATAGTNTTQLATTAFVATTATAVTAETTRATAAEATLTTNVAANTASISAIAPAGAVPVVSDRMLDSVEDGTQRAIDYVSPDGIVHIYEAKINKLNGVNTTSLILGQTRNAYAGDHLMNMNYMGNWGQSLAQTHVGGANLTTTQEGKSLGYSFGGGTTLAPLVVDAANGECPMFGMCGIIYELLAKENGLAASDLAFTPVTADNASGGTFISANIKGTPNYTHTITQAGALQTYAIANGMRARAFGGHWMQGEEDYNASTGLFANYYATLVQLAFNYAADLRIALPSQTFNPHFVTYAMCSRQIGINRFDIPRLQLQCAIDYINGVIPAGKSAPVAIGFSTPTHMMPRTYDPGALHVSARDAKWLGGYAGLYFKRVFIDGKPWPPMYPIAIFREGNALFVRFQMRAPGVKFVIANSTNRVMDGTAIPPQVNGGWAAFDTNTSSVISFSAAPDIVAPDTIRFQLASAPANGQRFDYAQIVAADMFPHVGVAGNFRDNYGDFVFYDAVNRPMHNWLSPHSFVLDSSTAGFSMSR